MPEPSSLTDIANLALSLMGQAPIKSIDNPNTQDAKTMRQWLPVIIKEVQIDIHWPENYTDLVPLTVAKEDFVVPGQFKYILPTDFLQLYEITADPNIATSPTVDARTWANPWWSIQAGFLICLVENTQIMYGRFNQTVADWSTQQREVIYTTLAAKLALEITNSEKIQDKLEVKLRMVKNRAQTSVQNKSRSFRTRPQNFNMATSRQASYHGRFNRGHT